MSQQINLFNPIFLKQKKLFSAKTMLQGLGLILLGSIAVIVYARLQLSGLSDEAVATANQLKTTQAQLAKVAADYAPKKKSSALEENVRRIEADLKAQQQVLDLVQKGDLGNTKGYSAYFRALSRQIISGLWLTGFVIDGNAIELRGRALQPELVPEYIGRLGQEPVMKGKSFSTLEMHVPLVDAVVKADAAASGTAGKTQRVPAGYIEFRLRSTGSANTGAGSPEISGAPGEAAEAGATSR